MAGIELIVGQDLLKILMFYINAQTNFTVMKKCDIITIHTGSVVCL